MSYPPPPASPYPAPSGGPVRLRGRTPRRLGWIFLVVGIVLFVVGIVIAGKGAADKVSKFQRVPVSSGHSTVQIDRTGKWVIYYETRELDLNSDRIVSVAAGGVDITAPNGQTVALQTYGNRSDGKIRKFTYDYDGHKGAASAQFNAPVKGAYSVSIGGAQGLPADADLAFGEDVVDATTVAGGIAIGVGVLLVIAAIVLLIVGYVKRGRHKKELASAGAGYGAYPPPGQGYGGPGYGGQGYSGQGYPGPGYGAPGQPQQGQPQPGEPQQGQPQQGFPPPGQGYPPPQQGYGSSQGYPPPQQQGYEPPSQ
jgi:hypothetical protein